MKNFEQFFPWTVVGLALLYLAVVMVPPADEPRKFHFQELGQLPVVDRGRAQPFDTKARTALMIISGRQHFVEEVGEGASAKEVSQPATRWMMDVMVTTFNPVRGETGDGPALKHKVFRIENNEVLNFLDLKARPGFRYSLKEIQPKMELFLKQADEIGRKDPKKLDLFEAKMLELAQHVKVFFEIANLGAPLMLPLEKDHWMALHDALKIVGGWKGLEKHPAGEAFAHLFGSYLRGDPEDFNETLVAYRKFLESDFPQEVGVTRFEAFFNNFAPFYRCAVLYVFVGILAVLSWLVWPQGFGKAAFALGVLTLLVHTWALIARMYIQGRPPVTNLYSSAVFIGWGCVVLGLFLEYVYRNGIGSLVGAVTGSLTLVIAHFLALSGDTLEMMQAVLDTNFWLATHVTCITLGYTATFFAGFLGIGYVLLAPLGFLRETFAEPVSSIDTNGDVPSIKLNRRGSEWKSPPVAALPFLALPLLAISPILVLLLLIVYFMVRNNKQIDPSATLSLSRMIYGVVCFATLLSFTGTVLGGIWADQSWGRFWGWDPKENGALLIVIWNALILHARWGGMVKARGIAVLAILGNIVTAWSWFGVNMLGVGLHSYGFMQGAVFWLLAFVASQLFFVGIGLLHPEFWRARAPVSRTEFPPEVGLPPGAVMVR